MGFIADLIYQLIYQPLVNILIVLYNYIPINDLGFSVIALTILIKLALYPLGLKSARSQREMESIQPEIKRIQEKYKDDKETQSRKIMEFYKEKKINPFAGITPIFIQLPILISLFQIFRRLTNPEIDGDQMEHLYSFVVEPETINYMFLGSIDLAKPFIVFAVLAAVGQYLQMKITLAGKGKEKKDKKDESSMSSIMQSQMTYFLPGFTFIILISMPSVIGLYWIITIIFAIIQHQIVKKEKSKESNSKEEITEDTVAIKEDGVKIETREKEKKGGEVKNIKGKKKHKNGKRKKKS